MRIRPLWLVLTAALLAACSKPLPAVHLATNCAGPEGSCARWLPALDNEGAPLARGAIVIPFSAPVRVVEKPGGVQVVGETYNFESRAAELTLTPVRGLRVDPGNPRQIVIEVGALVSDGAGIVLGDGAVLDGDGKALGEQTLKLGTGLSPFTVALAGVVWEPTDRALFAEEGTQKAKGQKGEGPVRAELEARLRIRPGIADEQVAAVLARYDEWHMKVRVPDNRVRAGLLLLTGTSAEYAIEFVKQETNRRGVPFQPVQVESLAKYGAFGAVFYNPLTGVLRMVIDSDVAADSLEQIAIVLAHETLHSSLAGDSASEETLAMASDTRIYQEFLLWDPALAQVPTELTRVANRLTLALRNSGRYGFPYAGVLPRPGVEDVLRGTDKQPARSFKDLLFKPDFYGEAPKAGDTGTEVLEAYYRTMTGGSGDPGRLKFDANTLKLYDKALDQGFSPEQIIAIHDALRLKPTAVTPRQ